MVSATRRDQTCLSHMNNNRVGEFFDIKHVILQLRYLRLLIEDENNIFRAINPSASSFSPRFFSETADLAIRSARSSWSIDISRLDRSIDIAAAGARWRWLDDPNDPCSLRHVYQCAARCSL